MDSRIFKFFVLTLIVIGVKTTLGMGPWADADTSEASSTAFSFVVVSDTHAGRDAFEDMARYILQNEDVKFILAAGDNVNLGCRKDEYELLVDVYDEYNPVHPMYPAMGSHEAWACDDSTQQQIKDQGKTVEEYNRELWRQYFGPNIQSLADQFNGDVNDYYSFDYKNLHVALIWSGEVNHPSKPGWIWLEIDLANSNADWKIVIEHFPLISPKTIPGEIDSDILREMKVYEETGLDIHVAGHSHYYERSVPLTQGVLDPEYGVHYFMVGPSTKGQGSGHTLSQGAFGDDINNYLYLEAFEGRANYAKVTIDGNTLLWEGKLSDGTVFDTFYLDKSAPTSVPADRVVKPKQFNLEQNYPNPFNPSTIICYSIQKADFVQLRIYNIMGELIRTLVNEDQPGGEHTVLWDGRNKNGEVVANGIYYYRLRVGALVTSRKMLMLK